MTQNRRSKRVIRSPMAQTGEKYTEARRAHLASGGHSGDASAGEYPAGTITLPEDSLGWFTDQAYNTILLAADEARMLSHPPGRPRTPAARGRSLPPRPASAELGRAGCAVAGQRGWISAMGPKPSCGVSM